MVASRPLRELAHQEDNPDSAYRMERCCRRGKRRVPAFTTRIRITTTACRLISSARPLHFRPVHNDMSLRHTNHLLMYPVPAYMPSE